MFVYTFFEVFYLYIFDDFLHVVTGMKSPVRKEGVGFERTTQYIDFINQNVYSLGQGVTVYLSVDFAYDMDHSVVIISKKILHFVPHFRFSSQHC